jgi:hypothetical protein
MKSRFYEIKFTAASDQVLNCQPKIVILNNIYITQHFVWAIKQSIFVYWLYGTLNKALVFWGGFWANSGYILQYLPHIFSS